MRKLWCDINKKEVMKMVKERYIKRMETESMFNVIKEIRIGNLIIKDLMLIKRDFLKSPDKEYDYIYELSSKDKLEFLRKYYKYSNKKPTEIPHEIRKEMNLFCDKLILREEGWELYE